MKRVSNSYDYLDVLISKALKELAEEAKEKMPDVENSWAEFEKRIKAKKLRQEEDKKINGPLCQNSCHRALNKV